MSPPLNGERQDPQAKGKGKGRAPNQSQRGNSKDQWLCGSAEWAIGCQVFFFCTCSFFKDSQYFFVYDFRFRS
eukprot:symbB.v1.2.022923.t1/scaffold2055.1/size90941/9